ncbi:MAG: sterol desaturase family protein [Flavobacteriaceae bacterium]|nr:sterol desaturase family protein [Flavobacteriaceae bacterium]
MEFPRIIEIIDFATPIYVVLIFLEMAMSLRHNKQYYEAKDSLINVFFSVLNLGLAFFVRMACLGFLYFFFQFHIFEISYPIFYWLCLFLLQDMAFYFQHRVDHYCRFFWAVHVTHHSSEYFNLTTGFRSSVFQPLYWFVYFIPLVLLGFKPLDIMLMYAITQIYGILIHTQFIAKMGFLEYFMSTPSHHRVHHASNIQYLDKNMGMVLIIWDKLFGTFQQEEDTEPVRFGLTKKIPKPNDPFQGIFHEWKAIGQDLRRDLPLKIRLKYVFKPPGWSHDGSTKTSKELREDCVKK